MKYVYDIEMFLGTDPPSKLYNRVYDSIENIYLVQQTLGRHTAHIRSDGVYNMYTHHTYCK